RRRRNSTTLVMVLPIGSTRGSNQSGQDEMGSTYLSMPLRFRSPEVPWLVCAEETPDASRVQPSAARDIFDIPIRFRFRFGKPEVDGALQHGVSREPHPSRFRARPALCTSLRIRPLEQVTARSPQSAVSAAPSVR